MLAVILEFRDMARREQGWIDDLLHDETFEGSQLEALHGYKVRLAQVEESAMLAIAHGGSERQADADWWGRRGGPLVGEVLGIGPNSWPYRQMAPAHCQLDQSDVRMSPLLHHLLGHLTMVDALPFPMPESDPCSCDRT